MPMPVCRSHVGVAAIDTGVGGLVAAQRLEAVGKSDLEERVVNRACLKWGIVREITPLVLLDYPL